MAKKRDKTGSSRKSTKPAKTSERPAGFATFDDMREEMQRMMQGFLGADWPSPTGRFPHLGGWPFAGTESPFAAMMSAPRADMSESDQAYELNVELPGLDEKDIEVTLTDRALVLKGEKKEERKSDEKDYHFTERSYGTIRRQFPLPADVDREALTASFNKGVLTVTLPKTSEAQAHARRIEVKGG